MELLKKWLFLITLSLTAQHSALATSLRDGLNLDLIYCEVPTPEAGGTIPDGCTDSTSFFGTPFDMDIDPLTGNLYIAQNTADGGNILVVDPATGPVNEIPFFSQGLAFAPDGTLYFGVSNLLLATWRRDSAADPGVFRIFSSIPKVTDVQVSSDGTLYVAASRFGPNSLFLDTVLKVDTNDGFFEPVVIADNVKTLFDFADADMQYATVGENGDVTMGFHSGTVIRKSASGVISSINRRTAEIGGLNNTGLTNGENGIVYQLDPVDGKVFAIQPDGTTILAAAIDELKASTFTDNALVFDGSSLFILTDAHRLYRLSAASGTLGQNLTVNTGTGSISGHVVNQSTGEALVGATIALNTGEETSTDANGDYSFSNIATGLYEVSITAETFISQFATIKLENNANEVIDVTLSDGLPLFVAPGLVASKIGDKINNGINDSTDVNIDSAGNLYSLNHTGDTITKLLLDPATRELESSYILARGSISGAWTVGIDADFNIIAVNGNRSVFKFPTLPDQQTTELTVVGDEMSDVVDQSGVNRTISLVGDVDGMAVLSTGEIILSSGSGAGPIPNFPEGTFNTLVGHKNGAERIYSDGKPASGGDSFFNNNDIIRADDQDRLMVGTANGNLVRVKTDRTAELVWPGDDGPGGLESVGGFSNLSDDHQGNLWVRGGFPDANDASQGTGALRMINGNSLMTAVAAGMRCWSGVAWDTDGKTVYVANKNLIFKVTTLDGRTIADNLLDPPSGSATQEPLKTYTIMDSPPIDVPLVDFDKARIAWDILQPKEETTAPSASIPETSSGGSTGLAIILLLLMMGYRRSKFIQK